MRRKILALILAATSVQLVACSPKQEKELTAYDITASLSADRVLTASVECDYVNNTDVPLDEVWFNLYPNAFRHDATVKPLTDADKTEAYPNGYSCAEFSISAVTVDGENKDVTVTGTDENVLSVNLGKTIEPTTHAVIKIDYTVKLPNMRHRFGYTDNSVNLCNFYPIACVYRDGTFVENPYYSTGDPFFSECADYRVKLDVPDGYICAFTGTADFTKGEDGTTTYTVKADNVRDFAAVCGKFEKISGLAGTTIVNYYYYSDAEPERALNTAITAMNTFDSMFGGYPYPEYSVVQTGLLHGGMEYPCMSLISDKYTGDSYNDIIVHETAHQWWYGVVGNDESKYPWLDEGLAEYSDMLFYEQNTEGFPYTFNGKRADALSAYMLYCETYKDNGLGDTSMTRAVNEYADSVEYTYMTYVKGALMLDDIRNTIGTKAFTDGLRNYYDSMKYAVAEPQDLIGAMEKASKRNLKGLFDSWLDGDVKLYSTH